MVDQFMRGGFDLWDACLKVIIKEHPDWLPQLPLCLTPRIADMLEKGRVFWSDIPNYKEISSVWFERRKLLEIKVKHPDWLV